ncbi:MAG: response regulator transcription factor [Actinobacteria bacterium]|jgi:DNA-binding response OmpR family regulator|nr:response regulator transcription factor [Actinomycetota bacterium]
MNILIVEDEPRIAAFLERGLKAEGFGVEVAPDGETGYALACSDDVDLVVLDLMLPGMPGEQVLTNLRRRRPDVPVIILTARDAVEDRVAGLNNGADDYVTKPFSFVELLARIHARLRARDQVTATELVAGGVTLDLRSRTARMSGREVSLTAREFALLETFMRHPNQVLSQVQLMDRVWGYDFDPGSNVVEVYVGYLRRKLDKDLIETVRGAGYRLRAGTSNGTEPAT